MYKGNFLYSPGQSGAQSAELPALADRFVPAACSVHLSVPEVPLNAGQIAAQFDHPDLPAFQIVQASQSPPAPFRSHCRQQFLSEELPSPVHFYSAEQNSGHPAGPDAAKGH